MSAPVDVLAVLATEIADIADLSSSTEEGERRLREREANLRRARAAVAELIETAIVAHAACRARKEPDLIALADALDGIGAKAARKAAFRRVGGPEVAKAAGEQTDEERYVEGLQR